ncbi:SDR family NAD(P)-dependent oxidoreductase [Streptomyces sp. NPDC087226]|uniref:SDR family NAD(P)-dependent oxidoreductase n=1 Tax=Streptomyces sp. NPDC087226 TaxID=3365771 RepID=UPI0037FA3AA6
MTRHPLLAGRRPTTRPTRGTAIRAMESTGGGAIVNTAPMNGVIAIPDSSEYTASKHAVSSVREAESVIGAAVGIPPGMLRRWAAAVRGDEPHDPQATGPLSAVVAPLAGGCRRPGGALREQPHRRRTAEALSPRYGARTILNVHAQLPVQTEVGRRGRRAMRARAGRARSVGASHVGHLARCGVPTALMSKAVPVMVRASRLEASRTHAPT